jgi:tetratricopeptide (TPR) repeat protein
MSTFTNNQLDILRSLEMPVFQQRENSFSNKSFEEYFNAGLIHLQNNLNSIALNNFQNALKINPYHFDALQLSALLESELNNNESSIIYFQKAIAINESNPFVYNNCGLVFDKIGKWEQAIEYFSQAVKLKPDFAQAYNNIGISYQHLKKFSLALKYFDLSIKSDYKFADPFYNKANILKEFKKYDQAYLHFKIAIEINSNFIQSFFSLGLMMAELNKYEEALTCFNKVLEIDQNSIEALNNKGNLLQHMNRFDEALICYNKALQIKPDLSQAHNNIGNLYHRLNRPKEASSYYEKAISLSPNFAEAHWNNALANLIMGNYKLGWKEFEWRWHSDYVNHISKRRNFQQTLWTGNEPLESKTILVYSEQGLGDTIHFSRFIEKLSSFNCKIFLEVQPSLTELLSDLPGNFDIYPSGTALPSFDYHCPLLSLPLALGIEEFNIPLANGYLNANPIKIDNWSKKLGPKIKPRIGLVCSGSKDHTNDLVRSFKIDSLLPFLPDMFEYHILQKEIRAVDQPTLDQNKKIKTHISDLTDFSETAALVKNMDLIISVDTSVAHLAGSLGHPTWILLPFRSDWRWSLNRKDSSWYKSASLIRQSDIDDWQSVFNDVNTKLSEHFSF